MAEKDQRGAHLPAQGRGNGRTEDARLIPLSKETKVRSWQKKANGQLTFEDRGGGTGHRNGQAIHEDRVDGEEGESGFGEHDDM